MTSFFEVRKNLQEALLRRGKKPFELLVARLCEKYHKLPSEILNEEMFWINVLVEVECLDGEQEEMKVKSDRVNEMMERRNGK